MFSSVGYSKTYIHQLSVDTGYSLEDLQSMMADEEHME